MPWRRIVGHAKELVKLDAAGANDKNWQRIGWLRTQIDVVLDEGAGVLNADDERVAELASLCDGEVLLYSLHANNATIAAHRNEKNGRAVFLLDGRVVLAHGSKERVLGQLSALPLASGTAPDTASLLAAIATAWALDIAPDLIAAGIKTFEYQR